MKKAERNKIFLLEIISVSILTTAIVLLLIALTDLFSKDYSYKTEAIIISWKLAGFDRHGVPQYIVNYAYTYDKNGQSYVGTKMSTSLVPPKTGVKMKVYVCPSQPNMSSEWRTNKKRGWLCLAFGAVLLIAAGGVYMLLQNIKKRS